MVQLPPPDILHLLVDRLRFFLVLSGVKDNLSSFLFPENVKDALKEPNKNEENKSLYNKLMSQYATLKPSKNHLRPPIQLFAGSLDDEQWLWYKLSGISVDRQVSVTDIQTI